MGDNVEIVLLQLGNKPVPQMTPSMQCEYGTETPLVSAMLATFEDNKRCRDIEADVLRRFNVDADAGCASLKNVARRDVDADGLHVGVHAGTMGASDLVLGAKGCGEGDLAALIYTAMAGRYVPEMVSGTGYDPATVNMLRVHLRANIAFCLHPSEYDALVASHFPVVDMDDVLPGDGSITVLIESPLGMSTYANQQVHYPQCQMDPLNCISVRTTRDDIIFLDAGVVHSDALALAPDSLSEVLSNACAATKSARLVVFVVPSARIAIVAWHLKYVRLPDYPGEFPSFCVDFGIHLLEALQNIIADAVEWEHVPASRCRVVGDMNLQTSADGDCAMECARRRGYTIFNSGRIGSSGSPPGLALTAYGTRRNIAGTEQLSKVGQRRDKPSMCVFVPPHGTGAATALVVASKTPSVEWPFDHVPILHTVSDGSTDTRALLRFLAVFMILTYLVHIFVLASTVDIYSWWSD